MTDIDTPAIRAAAAEATKVYPATNDRNTDLDYSRQQDAARRAFHALANPQTVTALLDQLDAAKARVANLEEMVGRFACECSGRCERMEWMPADNGACAYRAARALLNERAE